MTITVEQILKPGTIIKYDQSLWMVMATNVNNSAQDLNDLNYYLRAVDTGLNIEVSWYDRMTLWNHIESVQCTCCQGWAPLSEVKYVEATDYPNGRLICSHCLSTFEDKCSICQCDVSFEGEGAWTTCDKCHDKLCDEHVIFDKEDNACCPTCAHS